MTSSRHKSKLTLPWLKFNALTNSIWPIFCFLYSAHESIPLEKPTYIAYNIRWQSELQSTIDVPLKMRCRRPWYVSNGDVDHRTQYTLVYSPKNRYNYHPNCVLWRKKYHVIISRAAVDHAIFYSLLIHINSISSGTFYTERSAALQQSRSFSRLYGWKSTRCIISKYGKVAW